jgi:hypothetical protein
VDDRLPLASLDRVQGGNGIVEGGDVADVRPQSSVTHPLDDLTQLGTIGLDNEVDRRRFAFFRFQRLSASIDRFFERLKRKALAVQ